MSKITIPHNYSPRPYQLPFLKAMDSGFSRAVLVWHRRSGKEKTCINFMSKKMLERVGIYYYVFPTFAQGKKVLWDGIDRDGHRFLDHFPKEICDGKQNDTEMKLRYKNGSLFQIIGSDKIDSIVGTNPVGVVFSEYSVQDPLAWGFLRPILAENGGWVIFNFTPRGENHAYDIYNLAKKSPDWYCDLKTVDDTNVMSKEILDRERAEIIHQYGTDSLYQQEYFCCFDVPLVGAYYGEIISRLYQEGRVTNISHEPRFKVDTWWDLGINDRMSIWFSQTIGSEIRFIDYYENSGQGLPHYIAKFKEKPYIYGRHTAPHDIEVRELTSGVSRRNTAANLGIDFIVAPDLPLNDGIDAVRNVLSRCWFDKEKCKDGLNALKSYRKIYDEKKKTYLNHPYHDWSSNGADAFRYFAVGFEFEKTGYDVARPDKYMMRQREMNRRAFNPMTV